MMPMIAVRNKYSAIVSSLCAKWAFLERIARKEKKHEKIRKAAIEDVNSSIILVAALFVI
ncbi:hypothetical protein [Mucilaginibacter agri]|uniref:Uncharacterized protein n=1 Tax=Mucilaginibacter agri TaxID=2695265 RepID=A0A965ZJI8_9SPHI|nr:hypothetical protein [Mucilaginibacter agri]NCD71114.1 hypothetical protein [Mucilaginibacter agri]